ncbi:MAG TPA: PEGA domain-containing protein [Polyangiaceae bacterium]|nr:PEGA domain-containing protein [Polyangiaceae bacterium]
MLGLGTASSVALDAHAEPGGTAQTEADRTRARELMREGNELYGEGKLAEAYEKYRQAWLMAQAFDIACNLGGTASELSMNRDAAEYLDYCLRHYAASSRPEAVAAEQRARAAFDVVRAKVAAVNLKVTPAGAEVFVDGKSVGRAPLEAPLFIEAGPHRIEARQTGLDSGVLELNAKRGEATEAVIELKPAPGTAAAAANTSENKQDPQQDTASQSKNYVPAIVTASVGGLALAGGVVFLVMRSGKQSDASDKLDTLSGKNPCGTGLPSESEATCAEIADLSDQAATFGTLSIVSFGVAAGAGVGTFLLWPKSTETGFRGLRPALAASPEGLYASVRGAF